MGQVYPAFADCAAVKGLKVDGMTITLAEVAAAGTAVKLGNEHKRAHRSPGGGAGGSTTTVRWKSTATVSVPGPTTTVVPPKKPGKGVSHVGE